MNGSSLFLRITGPALIVLAILAMQHVWLDIFAIAMRDQEASHILLAPLVFGWLLWVRLDTPLWTGANNSWLGLSAVLLGLAAHEIGLSNNLAVLFHLSAILVLLGAFAMTVSRATLRQILPALVVLLFMAPVPGMIRQQASMPLQQASASLAHAALSSMGLSIQQQGCKLSIQGADIMIAEACNGMRMMLACFLSLYAFCYSAELRPRVRWLLLLLLPLIAIALNIVRIIATVLMYVWTTEPTAAAFHNASGWGIPLLAVFSIAMIAGWDAPPVKTTTLPAPKQRWGVVAIGALLLLSICLLQRARLPRPVDVEHHQRQVRRALESYPYAIGDWVGIDVPLHDEEIALLKPSAALRRTYRHTETQHEATLFLVATEQARDLVGHEPGICYVSQGWLKRRERPATCTIDDLLVFATDYEFYRKLRDGRDATHSIYSVLVTPRGATTGSTAKLAHDAGNYRWNQFGSAACQLTFSSPVHQQLREETLQAFVRAFLPTIHQFQHAAAWQTQRSQHND